MSDLKKYWYNILKEKGINVEDAPGPCFVASSLKFTKNKGWFVDQKMVTVAGWSFFGEEFIIKFLKEAKKVFLYDVEKRSNSQGEDFLLFRMHPIFKNNRYCLKTKEKITDYYG